MFIYSRLIGYLLWVLFNLLSIIWDYFQFRQFHWDAIFQVINQAICCSIWPLHRLPIESFYWKPIIKHRSTADCIVHGLYDLIDTSATAICMQIQVGRLPMTSTAHSANRKRLLKVHNEHIPHEYKYQSR